MTYNDSAKSLLDDLLSPIPFFARPMAKKAIEKEIFAQAEAAGHATVDEDDVVRGYIIAGTKKDTDKEKIKSVLTGKGFDISKYQDLLA
ncbi:DUF2621 family protein [Tumebacillus sp. DT12]|uniref:DUF2621 family protein n=1 Tax=Tumebacillus lacus TaxID=2995335 RepID=A0ABT3X556_9BACL|nr:DUF2621 family protein [Tumebacillus lacus]MCX7570715.1 DUF2621 family protein [Tumebacillus lacus]